MTDDEKDRDPAESERALDPQARSVFELSPAAMLLVDAADGRVVELNAAGHQLFGGAFRAGTMNVVRGDDDGDEHELLLHLEGRHRRLPLNRRALPDREDLYLAALVDERRPELLPENLAERVLPPIGAMTDRILHDVRNLILPLSCHMDLAMASVDTTSEVYHALLEVQGACRRCEGELEKLATLSGTRETPPRFLHVEDVLERCALLLRYLLPRQVEIKVDVEVGTRLINASPNDLQRRVVHLAGLAHDRRARVKSLLLGSRNVDDGVVMTIALGAPVSTDEDTLALERESLGEQLDGDGQSLTVAVELDAEGIEFELRVASSACARPEDFDEKGGAPGHGERVAILHSRPMMRDLISHYLESKNYKPEICPSCDDLLDALADGRDAVVADVSDVEAAHIAEAIDRGETPGLRALVLSRGHFRTDADIPYQRLQPPFRIDEVASSLRSLLDEADPRT